MGRVDLPIVGDNSESRSRAANIQRTVNWYPQQEASGGFTASSLYPTPGLKLYGNAGGGGTRCNGVKWNGNGYFVVGTDVVQITPSKVFTTVGTINTSTGRVGITKGLDMLMITDGQDGWTYNGSVFAQIVDPDFPANPTYCTYLDGYFYVVINDSATGDRFYKSASGDATSWNALDFGVAEANPDVLKRPVALQGRMYLFGDETTEVWYPNNNPDFPLEVYQNGIMQWGIDAPDSVGKADNALFWLGKNEEGNKVVLSCRGLTAEIISNRDLEWRINLLNKTDNAEGFCYRDAGHTFYCLTFPSANVTYCFDLANGMWHERSTWNIGRWRVGGHLYLDGLHIVGDYDNNKFYTLDNDTYTDDGEVIERLRRGIYIDNKQLRTFWNRLELEFQAGVGLNSGQGRDPQVMLRWSDDGGHTWSNELTRSIGKQGEYQHRAIWNMLGSSMNRVYEVRITDPVNAVLLKACADIEFGEGT